MAGMGEFRPDELPVRQCVREEAHGSHWYLDIEDWTYVRCEGED